MFRIDVAVQKRDTRYTEIKRYLPEDLDLIVSAEEYGKVYAEKLGIDSITLPIERKDFPVSGTSVRDNPFLQWAFLPDVVRPYYVKRIAIMGAESCGKSTLTKLLAKHFSTVYVEEYGRTLYEQQNGRLDEMDFIDIQKGRQIIEDALMKQANKFLFCDTEDITTVVSFDLYYPNGSIKVKQKIWANMYLKKPYDLYILLKPDCPAIQDGTRGYLEVRERHHENLKAVLDARECNYVEVGGSFQNRFKVTREMIQRFIMHKRGPLADKEIPYYHIINNH